MRTALCAFLLTLNLLAQQSVALQFHVQERDTNRPVQNAVVQFELFPLTLVTNIRGDARLQNGRRLTTFPPSTHFKIQIAAVGYYPTERSFTSPGACNCDQDESTLELTGQYTIDLVPICAATVTDPTAGCGSKRTKILRASSVSCLDSTTTIACVEYTKGVACGTVKYTEQDNKKVKSSNKVSGELTAEAKGVALELGLSVKAKTTSSETEETELSNEITVVADIGSQKLADDICGEVCLNLLQVELTVQTETLGCYREGNQWVQIWVPEMPRKIRVAVGHCICLKKKKC